MKAGIIGRVETEADISVVSDREWKEWEQTKRGLKAKMSSSCL